MPCNRILFLLLATPLLASAQMQVTEADGDTLTVARIVKNYFAGKGIARIQNIVYRGDTQSVGVFSESSGILGMKEGIVLSTGLAVHAAGPNSRANAGANLEGFFFSDEYLISKGNMCDGTVLSFEFVPQYDSVVFDYLFGSDEYPEFVGKEFNDLFGFYIFPKQKQPGHTVSNLACLPNKTGISINTVNQKRNSEWFVHNDKHTAQAFDILEWDGYTKPLSAGMRVVPYKTYVLHMVVADLTDCEYDSGVLLRQRSFRSIPTKPKRIKPVMKRYYFNFGTNDARLNEQETKRLKNVCDSVGKLSLDSVVVIGHTDSTGNEVRNHELSNLRAQTVAEALQTCTTAKVLHRGAGSSKPIAPNQTEKGKAANRRVELLFYRKPAWAD
jgi:outer membrane protein OmpA-like peptidoglycan-associated protein